jgi:putative membrane protein
MLLMGALFSEYLIVKIKITSEGLRMLSIANSIFVISLVIVLLSGLLRWFMFGKGHDFYMTNPFFHTKLTLYIILAIVAFFPGKKINKWKRQLNGDASFQIVEKEKKSLFLLFRIEFMIIIIIPLLAVLVARGNMG